MFHVEAIRFESPEGTSEQFYCLDAPDWINVIPLTLDGNVVLLRQYRFGVEAFTLEIPGGMCDPGESPRAAAARELREEAGCEAAELIDLGWVHPNPAIQGNRCHTFLAQGAVRVGPPEPGEHEAFELIETPLSTIPDLIRSSAISHALVITAFHLLSARSFSDR